VFMTESACNTVTARGGRLCGYDGGGPGNGVGHDDLVNEPHRYTAIGSDPNGCSIAGHEFISPSKFIDQNHF
ncbi:MAG: hypothetical protein AAGC55_23685, partial [Myxococcota bacterium]